eukprot:CAMPEP_0197387066 /NCGR_PEP_ID=MMETSP1165-20131217/300_1 /TAXON_ID=284809 /ORGANISM="Chrysocystis fragilis, Strain CCMP3189" /LENGTH=581 /DNA_ID=CAMNT_0042912363 /DNA_START=1073 /DNA_END=2814 /DNA_ORIENTATION=+
MRQEDLGAAFLEAVLATRAGHFCWAEAESSASLVRRFFGAAALGDLLERAGGGAALVVGPSSGRAGSSVRVVGGGRGAVGEGEDGGVGGGGGDEGAEALAGEVSVVVWLVGLEDLDPEEEVVAPVDAPGRGIAVGEAPVGLELAEREGPARELPDLAEVEVGEDARALVGGVEERGELSEGVGWNLRLEHDDVGRLDVRRREEVAVGDVEGLLGGRLGDDEGLAADVAGDADARLVRVGRGRGEREHGFLGELVSGVRELDAVDPLQVGELEKGLHGDLPGAHPEVEEGRGASRVEVALVERLVDAPRQELAVQQAAVVLAGGPLVLLGDAGVPQRLVARLLDPAAVALVERALRLGEREREVLGERPRLGQALRAVRALRVLHLLRDRRVAPVHDVERRPQHHQPPPRPAVPELDAVLPRRPVVLRDQALAPLPVLQQHRDPTPHQARVAPRRLALEVALEPLEVIEFQPVLVASVLHRPRIEHLLLPRESPRRAPFRLLPADDLGTPSRSQLAPTRASLVGDLATPRTETDLTRPSLRANTVGLSHRTTRAPLESARPSLNSLRDSTHERHAENKPNLP